MIKFQDHFESIEWHDLPVQGIYINAEQKSLNFRIKSFNEELDDYEVIDFKFSEIISISTTEGDLNDILSFDSKYDLEFNYCSYSLNSDDIFHFEFLILLGSGKPVIKFEVSTKNVTLSPAV